jgi:F-type H+-transporting ATPase subunit b
MDFYNIIIAATEVVQEAAEETAGGPLGTLGINWKLFVAQLVNFSIVLFIFWRWVVKPLGKTLTDRQTKIESGLKNAVYMEDEKKKFEEWKKGEMQTVRDEAEKVLKTATDTADKIKQETVGAAQNQANKIIELAKVAIESEKIQALKEVKSNVAELVIMATEKIIKTKLDPKKDHDLVKESVKEIT